MEFQPSSFSKGSYLNVGVMWLWSNLDHIAFDEFERLSGHSRYVDDEQFMGEAQRLAVLASNRIAQYRAMFPSPLDAASYLAHQSKTPSRALNCGLAYALAGDVPSALSHLMAYLEDEPSTEWQVKQREVPLRLVEITDPSLLAAGARAYVATGRASLGLPESPNHSIVE